MKQERHRQQSYRRDRYDRGRRAEFYAAFLLFLRGYRVLARNFKPVHRDTLLGEVDLILRKGRNLYFCEIKWRPDPDAGLDAISVQQQQRIMRTASFFMQKHPHYHPMQPCFMAIVVYPHRVRIGRRSFGFWKIRCVEDLLF